MGFLLCGMYYVLRRNKPLAANGFLYTGLAYGTAMGIGRMAQGGHFASDVLWAGGMTILSAQLSVYLVEKIEPFRLFAEGKKTGKKRKNIILPVTISVLLGAALVFFFLIATPFYKEYKDGLTAKPEKIELVVNLAEGDITIRPSEDGLLGIDFKANGFAMPGRVYEKELKVKEESGVFKADFSTTRKGIFSEVNAALTVWLPRDKEYTLLVTTEDGDVVGSINNKTPGLIAYSGTGKISFDINEGASLNHVYIKSRKSYVRLAIGQGAKLVPTAELDLFAGKELSIMNYTKQLKGLMMEKEKINGAKEMMYRGNKPETIRINAKAGKITISD
jgi:hypothetical protein